MKLLKAKNMEKKEFDFSSDLINGYKMGDWSLCYSTEWFYIDEYGSDFRRLYFTPYEDPERIVFDEEKKTVSVKVKHPFLWEEHLRMLDLSDSIEFFNELRKDIDTLLMKPTEYGDLFDSVASNEDRTVFEPHLRQFGKKEIIEYYDAFQVGEWFVGCWPHIFEICHKGVRLAFVPDEIPESIEFDVDRKTVSVRVKYPILPNDTPRTVDISDSVEFFDELRSRIDTLLTSEFDYSKTYEKVLVNEDMTVFEPFVYEKREYDTGSLKGFRMGGWNEWNVWIKDGGKKLFGITYTDHDNYENNKSWTLFNYGEEPERIVFDVEKKTLSVWVKGDSAPRTVDLSECVWFFDELRKGVDNLLMEKFNAMSMFRSITANEDRTIFELHLNSN